MINSMTGYGNAQGQVEGVTYTVEIKTVNNRFFKSVIRLPEPVSFLEEQITKLLRENISRGTVNYSLKLKNESNNLYYDMNQAALKSYMGKLKDIVSSMDSDFPIDVGGLLSLPGILIPVVPDEQKAKQLGEQILEISSQAIKRLKKMRAVEGKALTEDLMEHCKVISTELEQVCKRSDEVLKRYHEKLEKRINELLAKAKLKIDEQTLARELAIFAERSDISEEVARLESHLQQFADCCDSSGDSQGGTKNNQIGRKLDFICQEMLREVNTIASKAADCKVVNCVVEMKCRVDRIKEQVQNIE